MEKNPTLLLLEKCGTQNRYEVRLRAISSLLFKLQHNLIDEEPLQTQPFYLRSIIKSLLSIVSSITGYSADSMNTEESFITDLLCVVDHFMQYPIVKSVAPEESSIILNKFYYATTIHSISTTIKQRFEKSIANINNLSTVEEKNIEESQIPDSFQVQAGIECVGHYSPSGIDDIPRGVGSGAGSIMYTKVVQDGWKFPYVYITDVDEKYLFDLEVKLKLRHDSAGKLLLDAASNFPPEVMLQRPGLLQAILDCIGAPFSDIDYESDPYGCHPVSFINSLCIIMRKSEKAYLVYLDGGLVTQSLFQRPPPTQGAEDTVVQNILEMRYPGNHGIPDHGTRRITEQCFPRPSYSGVAFAILAATLPLLRSKDSQILYHIRSLISVLLPYIVEHSENVYTISALNRESSENTILSLNVKRLQHLVSRIDQLCTYINPTVEFEDFFAAVKSDVNLTGYAEDVVLSMVESTFKYSVLKLLMEILQIIVRYSISNNIKDSFKYGNGIKSVLIRLLLESRRYYMVLKIPFEELAERILSQYFPEHLDSVVYLRSLSESLYFFTSSFSKDQANSSVIQLDQGNPDGLLEMTTSYLERARDLCSVDFPVEVSTIEIVQVIPLLLCITGCEQHRSLQFRTVEVLREILCRGKYTAQYELLQSIINHMDRVQPYSSDPSSYLTYLDYQIFNSIEGRSLQYSSEYLLDTLENAEFLTIFCWIALDGGCTPQHEGISEVGLITPIQSSVLSILSRCCASLSFKLENSGFSLCQQIANVYLWLKTVLWKFGSIQSNLVGIEKVVAWVENHSFLGTGSSCNDESASLMLRDKYFNGLLLGFFHRESTIRQQSCMLIHHHIFGKIGNSDELSLQDWVGAFSFIDDLNEWQHSHQVRGSITQQHQILLVDSTSIGRKQNKQINHELSFKKAIFNHQDLQKLSILVFDATMEVNIRQSAIQQLRDMLMSDQQLLLTCSKSWIYEFLKKLSDLLFEFMFPGRKHDCKAECRLDVAEFTRLRKVECDLYSQGIFLLYHLLKFYPGALEFISLIDKVMCKIYDDAELPCINLSPLLTIAFAAETIFKAGTPNNANSLQSMISEGMIFLKKIAYLSLSVLHFYCFNSSSWKLIINKTSKLDQVYLPLSAYQANAMSAMVPTFLTTSFLNIAFKHPQNLILLDSSSASIAKAVCYQVANLVVSNPTKSIWPQKELIEFAIADINIPMQHSLDVAMVTTTFDLFLHANNHKQLHWTVLLGRNFRILNPTFDYLFVSLGIRLVSALSNIISTPPRIKRDKFIYFEVMDFLTEHLKCLFSDHRFERDVQDVVYTMLQVCLKNINEAISLSCFEELRVSSGHYPQALLYSIHASLLKFLTAATAFPSINSVNYREDVSVQDLLMEHGKTLLISILDGILYNEDCPCHLRNLALAIVSNLFLYHKGGSILRGLDQYEREKIELALLSASDPPRNENTWNLKYFYPLHRLIRFCKVLRFPDSFQHNYLSSGSLSILVQFLQEENRESSLLISGMVNDCDIWKWTIRMLYDRRSEIKLLTLEVLKIIFPLFPTVVHDIHPSEDITWPPIQELLHICSDDLECLLVRGMSLHILASCERFIENTSNVAQLMNHMCNILESHNIAWNQSWDKKDYLPTSHKAIIIILEALDSLLDKGVVSLALLKSHKCAALITRTLESFVLPHSSWMFIAATIRVGMYDPQQETLFRHRCNANFKVSGAANSPTPESVIGFREDHKFALPLLRQFSAQMKFDARSASLMISEILLKLCKLDSELFRYSLQQVNFLESLTNSLDNAFHMVNVLDHGELKPQDFHRGQWQEYCLATNILDLLCSSLNINESYDMVKCFFIVNNDWSYFEIIFDALKRGLQGLHEIYQIFFSSYNAYLDNHSSGNNINEILLHFIKKVSLFTIFCVNDDRIREGLNLSKPIISSWCGKGFDDRNIDSETSSNPSKSSSLELQTPFLSFFEEFLRVRAMLQCRIALQSVRDNNGSHGTAAIFPIRLWTYPGTLYLDTALSIILENSNECAKAFSNFLSQQNTYTDDPNDVNHIEVNSTASSVSDACLGKNLISYYVSSIISVGELCLQHQISQRDFHKKEQDRPKAKNAKSNQSVPDKVSTNKWRSKTRDYVWNHNITIDSLAGSSQISVASLDGSQSRKSKLSSTSNGALPYRAFEIPDELKHHLWRTLVVLKTIFRSFTKVIDDSLRREIYISLVKMMRLLSPYSLLAQTSISTAYHKVFDDRTFHVMLVPSNGMIASALWSLLVCCTNGTDEPKFDLLHYYNLETSNIYGSFKQSSNNFNNSSILHYLVSIGVGKGFQSAGRWLALQLCSSLLLCSGTSPEVSIGGLQSPISPSPTLKISLSHILAIQIQDLLHFESSTKEGAKETMFHYFTVLASFLSPDRQGVSCYHQFSNDKETFISSATISMLQNLQGTVVRGSPSGNVSSTKDVHHAKKDMKLIPFPQLLLWLAEKYSVTPLCLQATCHQHNTDAYIDGLLCRVIGMLCQTSMTKSNVPSSLGHTLLNDQIVEYLCSIVFANIKFDGIDWPVRHIAAFALWNIVQQSEKAKATCKTVLLANQIIIDDFIGIMKSQTINEASIQKYNSIANSNNDKIIRLPEDYSNSLNDVNSNLYGLMHALTSLRVLLQ